MNREEDRLIQGNWGYAVIKDGAIWIPAVEGRLKPILQELYKRTGMKRMIFSSVLDPESLKPHLRNIVKEWDVWFEEAGDYSHCIEIDYQPAEAGEKTKEEGRWNSPKKK
ncbi:MAG: hypothetical protein HWN68_06450 [Desulfobacterales bacterium]|nr:hypothetical protein [Desulfobacterales bacterium]